MKAATVNTKQKRRGALLTALIVFAIAGGIFAMTIMLSVG